MCTGHFTYDKIQDNSHNSLKIMCGLAMEKTRLRKAYPLPKVGTW